MDAHPGDRTTTTQRGAVSRQRGARAQCCEPTRAREKRAGILLRLAGLDTRPPPFIRCQSSFANTLARIGSVSRSLVSAAAGRPLPCVSGTRVYLCLGGGARDFASPLPSRSCAGLGFAKGRSVREAISGESESEAWRTLGTRQGLLARGVLKEFLGWVHDDLVQIAASSDPRKPSPTT